MITHIESGKSLAHQNEEVEYKLIPECPGYRVGTDGTIWTCRRGATWKLLKSFKEKYHKVRFLGKTRYVHRLVLETFVGPCPRGMEGRHFPDRDTENNRLSNLSWSTRMVNMRDQVFHRTTTRGCHPSSKLNAEKVVKIRKDWASGIRQVDLAVQHGVSRALVCRIINGSSWGHLP